MAAAFDGVQVIGCTTAGEIGPAGYCMHSLVGASFSAVDRSAVAAHIGDLKQFDSATGHAIVQQFVTAIGSASSRSKKH
jgi:hypothetical protein